MTTTAPWRITLADVVLDERERSAVDEVLRGGWLSMGPRTEEFEAAFAERVPGHAVAVTNGTAALHLAAAALGIGPGDEVICPTLTFVASAAAMVQDGGDRAARGLDFARRLLDRPRRDRAARHAADEGGRRRALRRRSGGHGSDRDGRGTARAARDRGRRTCARLGARRLALRQHRRRRLLQLLPEQEHDDRRRGHGRLPRRGRGREGAACSARTA